MTTPPREIIHPYDESFKRFLVSKPTASELDTLARHEDHKSLLDRDHTVKLTDQLFMASLHGYLEKKTLLYRGYVSINKQMFVSNDRSYEQITLI